MTMRRFFVPSVLVVLLLACSAHPTSGGDGQAGGRGDAPKAPKAPAPPPEGSKPLTILYTSDIHGIWNAAPRGSKGTGPVSGGFVALDSCVREIRAEAGKSVLLLDAGDLMTGHPISNLTYSGVPGGALMAFMNGVGYDAWCLGNHEFDLGAPEAIALAKLAKFPTLSANLTFPDAPEGLVKPSTIIERGGLKIGIVGLMTEKLPRLLNRKTLGQVSVTPIVEAARREIAALDPKTDLIILLTHQGRDEDKALAPQVPGADIIVGGHSHTPLARPAVVAGVIVCQNEAKLRRLGRLDVWVKDDRVVSHEGRLLDLPAEGAKPGPEVEAVAREVDSLLTKKLEEVIGTAGRALGRSYYRESPLGNWVTDTLRAAAEADVALFNSGGLRADIRQGPITLGTIHQVLLDNYVCHFEATGREVEEIARTNALAAATEDHGILQVSGLSYRYKRRGKEVEVSDVKVGGKAVTPDGKYRVAGTDFILVSQPVKYLGFTPAKVEETSDAVTDVVIRAIRAAGEIAPPGPAGTRIVVDE